MRDTRYHTSDNCFNNTLTCDILLTFAINTNSTRLQSYFYFIYLHFSCFFSLLLSSSPLGSFSFSFFFFHFFSFFLRLYLFYVHGTIASVSLWSQSSSGSNHGSIQSHAMAGYRNKHHLWRNPIAVCEAFCCHYYQIMLSDFRVWRLSSKVWLILFSLVNSF